MYIFSRQVLTADSTRLLEAAVKTPTDKISKYKKVRLAYDKWILDVGPAGTLFCVEIWLSKNEHENAFNLLVI